MRRAPARYTVIFQDGSSLEARAKRTNALEARFYAAAGSGVPVALPEALFTEEAGADGLVIYRSLPPGKPQGEWTRADARAVIEDLAALHAAFWQAPPAGIEPVIEHLREELELARDGVSILLAMGGWPGFLAPAVLGQMEMLLADENRLLAPLRGLPQTLLHGDPWLPNWILLPGRRVLIDWQTAVSGPGICDLAYLVEFSGEAGAWPEPGPGEALNLYKACLLERLPSGEHAEARAVVNACDAASVVLVLARWPAYAARTLAPLRRSPALVRMWRALPVAARAWVGARAAWASPEYYRRAFDRFSERARRIYGC